MNAAGMFKNGECYDLIAHQGAGAYIGGTSTHNMRFGNIRNQIHLPFLSIHDKKLAVNFLGLPNQGDRVLVDKQITQKKLDDCPIGWSLMRSPDFQDKVALEKLIESLFWYHNKPDIDFIEINESCPNTAHGLSIIDDGLYLRLNIIADKFLRKRKRNLPVIVKFSNDINTAKLNVVIDCLIKLGFDGINLGNTSTRYQQCADLLYGSEKKLFDYFTHEFGGGISGSILKNNSLQLCIQAILHINKVKPNHEFNVIRCGGIDSADDLLKSNNAGIALNQWYTGYFANYVKFGDNIYRNLYDIK